jgi:hypothetical protein
MRTADDFNLYYSTLDPWRISRARFIFDDQGSVLTDVRFAPEADSPSTGPLVSKKSDKELIDNILVEAAPSP